MPATPDSSSSAYATGADLVASRDWRAVADLVADGNTRETSSGGAAGNAVTLKALKWASGQIEAAVTTGTRYTRADLEALLADNSVGTEVLTGLTCDLAFWYLTKRRKPGIRMEEVSGIVEAMDLLERLRLGERVFPFVETQAAGVADAVSLDPERTVQPMTPISQTAGRFFGRRANQQEY